MFHLFCINQRHLFIMSPHFYTTELRTEITKPDTAYFPLPVDGGDANNAPMQISRSYRRSNLGRQCGRPVIYQEQPGHLMVFLLDNR